MVAAMMPAWTPFVRAPLPKESTLERLKHAEDLAREEHVPVEVANAALADLDRDEIWLNSRYQVNIRRRADVDGQVEGWPEMIHLSIKRRDKAPLGPEHYRDFMLIRDELVGPEHEAVELYPRRSREVDVANQYHLWVLADDRISFPFGFHNRRKVSDTAGLNARQTPREAHHP
jgi:hypothetical protein